MHLDPPASIGGAILIYLNSKEYYWFIFICFSLNTQPMFGNLVLVT